MSGSRNSLKFGYVYEALRGSYVSFCSIRSLDELQEHSFLCFLTDRGYVLRQLWTLLYEVLSEDSVVSKRFI